MSQSVKYYLFEINLLVIYDIQGVPEKCKHIKNNCKHSALLKFYYFKCVKIFMNDNSLFFWKHFDNILNNYKYFQQVMGYTDITITMLGLPR